jgi:hypothetical protein
MSALIARLAPYSMIALAIAGVVIWGLIERNAAIGTELAAAKGVIEQTEKDKAANAKAVQQLAQKLQGEGLCGTGHARLRSVSCHARCF